MKITLPKGYTMFKKLFASLFAFLTLFAVSANAAALAAPDMADAIGSVTNVFGAVLGVAVLIYGFKKVKSLL